MTINISQPIFLVTIVAGLIFYGLNGFFLHPTTSDFLITPITWIVIGSWISICWPLKKTWSQYIQNKNYITIFVVCLWVSYPLLYFSNPELWLNIRELIANLFSALCSLLMIVERHLKAEQHTAQK